MYGLLALRATQGDENLHRPIANRPQITNLPYMASNDEKAGQGAGCGPGGPPHQALLVFLDVAFVALFLHFLALRLMARAQRLI